MTDLKTIDELKAHITTIAVGCSDDGFQIVENPEDYHGDHTPEEAKEDFKEIIQINEGDQVPIVKIAKLRGEAIKDYKVLRMLMHAEQETFDLSQDLPFADQVDTESIEDWRGHLGSIMQYIKWKFNLSEEDLK